MKKIITITMLVVVCFLAISATAQNNGTKNTMKTNEISAIDLYKYFKENNENRENHYKKIKQISGIATYVGPDVYALPSVELSEEQNVSGRVLCVLPFSDYLKLRKVSKGDYVTMEGDVRGFSKQYDIVVVKQCRISKINGKQID